MLQQRGGHINKVAESGLPLYLLQSKREIVFKNREVEECSPLPGCCILWHKDWCIMDQQIRFPESEGKDKKIHVICTLLENFSTCYLCCKQCKNRKTSI